MADFTAIILAGGKSRRMGMDKSLIKIDGQPLIQKLYQEISPSFNEIIISSNEKEKYSFLNLPVIEDEEKDRGPLMGIYSCLKATSNENNFVIACDIPNINSEFINNIIQESESFDALIPRHEDGKIEPLFAVYKKSLLPKIKEILDSGLNKISHLFEKCNTAYIKMDNSGWYFNLNTEKDLKVYTNKN